MISALSKVTYDRVVPLPSADVGGVVANGDRRGTAGEHGLPRSPSRNSRDTPPLQIGVKLVVEIIVGVVDRACESLLPLRHLILILRAVRTVRRP
jgi:hypothetical protein